ncbi:MAG TPA: hypothetical protein VN976_21925 [Verrucomicrobiae bacterium]|nr:hypothetical protein [Verrucomicrobiae bacterium]
MSKKDAISSPMQNAFGHTVSDRGTGDVVNDHNMCPVFGKPHDMGPDTIPTVFGTTVGGKGPHGSPGTDAAVSSTMGEK